MISTSLVQPIISIFHYQEDHSLYHPLRSLINYQVISKISRSIHSTYTIRKGWVCFFNFFKIAFKICIYNVIFFGSLIFKNFMKRVSIFHGSLPLVRCTGGGWLGKRVQVLLDTKQYLVPQIFTLNAKLKSKVNMYVYLSGKEGTLNCNLNWYQSFIIKLSYS